MPTPSVTAYAVPPPSRREAFRHRHVKGSLFEGAVAVRRLRECRLCSLLPSRLTPCHLPQGGRLFGTATSKAPSLRGLSPLGDWGSAACAHSFRHGCAVPPPSRREAFRHRHVKGSLLEGAVAVRRLGELPKIFLHQRLFHQFQLF